MVCKMHPESYDEVVDRNFPECIKKTHQRVDILKVFYENDAPLSASEIFARLNEKNPKTPYAFSTIYRNLLAFEKAGVITKTVFSTEDNAVYELKKERHKHYAVCLKCHKKIPIKTCPLHEISHDITATLPDFVVTGHQLEIYGYCSECSQNEN